MNKNSKIIVAIIQARMGSTRLPGKILRDVVGKPLLWHLINRLKFSYMINDIVLAVPTSSENDPLEDFAKGFKLFCIRGSEEDVLSRYYGAAVEVGSDIIVRLTADNPLVDPRLTDSIINAHLSAGSDYTSSEGFPLGLNVEVFSLEALARAYKEARLDHEREHVSPYIYQHPDLFVLNFVEAKGKLQRPDLRLTVDTEEDLKLIREIFKRLYRDGQIFYIEDIIEFLDKRPELTSINAHIRQRELTEQ